MATERKPKRARKKDRRNARRDEWRKYVERRRRQRWGVFFGSLVAIGVGLLITFVVFQSGDEEKKPSSSPSAAGLESVPVKRPVACGATLPSTAGSKKKTDYAKPVDQDLDPDKTYLWRLDTSCGVVDIELDLENSPKTSNSIAFLTRERFFDGTFFHRLVQDFVAQGGDPTGTGSSGPGYQVVEPPPEDIEYGQGIVAMAKAGADPAGASASQFFIVTSDTTKEKLTSPDYALLGEVVDGIDVVDKIVANGHVADQVPPSKWVYIERATIVEK